MYWSFVIAGYSFVGVALVFYTVWTLRQGRNLSRRVPPDRRRFLD